MGKTLKEITENYGINPVVNAVPEPSTGPRHWDSTHPDHHWEKAMETLRQFVVHTKDGGTMHRAFKAWDGDDGIRKEAHEKAKSLLNDMIDNHQMIVSREYDK